jgi:hypothetical protein
VCADCPAAQLAEGWPAHVLRPTFFVLGARQGGTAALLSLLKLHPRVRLPAKKGTHFFDMAYSNGFAWYARQFPLVPTPAPFGQAAGAGAQGVTTGDASAGYLASCVAAARLWAAVPTARLIVVVRDDPLERAWLTHRQRLDAGGKVAAVDAAGTAAWWDALVQDVHATQVCEADSPLPAAAWPWTCHCQPPTQHVPDYVIDGLYDAHLRRWRAYFPAAQLLVLSARVWERSPLQAIRQVESFLGLGRGDYSDRALAAARALALAERAPPEVLQAPHAAMVRQWYAAANAGLSGQTL